MNFLDMAAYSIEGFVKIWCPDTGEIFVNKRNAIHAENLSLSIANALSEKTQFISEIHFGNGGTTTDSVGNIVYRTTNTSETNADLYAPFYYKVIDKSDTTNNSTPSLNKTEVTHTSDTNYSDLTVTATIGTDEPILGTSFIFDELGLKSKGSTLGSGNLLTHVIFNPVTKQATNTAQVVYTLRFRITT